MKKSIFFAAVAVFMLMGVSASAQFMQSTGGSKASSSASVSVPESASEASALFS